MDDHGVLNPETQLAQGEPEGILLTTDADGNLAVPVSAEHVIRLFMQTSDVSDKFDKLSDLCYTATYPGGYFKLSNNFQQSLFCFFSNHVIFSYHLRVSYKTNWEIFI